MNITSCLRKEIVLTLRLSEKEVNLLAMFLNKAIGDTINEWAEEEPLFIVNGLLAALVRKDEDETLHGLDKT